MLISVVAESVRLVMTQYLLAAGGSSLSPLEGLFYISSSCTAVLAIQASYMEWPKLVRQRDYLTVPLHPYSFVAAACCGFMVNMLAIMVIKLASSLTLKVRHEGDLRIGRGFKGAGRVRSAVRSLAAAAGTGTGIGSVTDPSSLMQGRAGPSPQRLRRFEPRAFLGVRHAELMARLAALPRDTPTLPRLTRPFLKRSGSGHR
jgi:hypothetical protein